MADVAEAAGVSLSTVSNVLNGRLKRMSPETRGRVEQAIEELGYTRSQAARQLKTGSAPSVIGLLVPTVANPFYGALAHRIEAAALGLGYQVLLGNTQRDPQLEQAYVEGLWAYGAQRLIVASSMADLSHLTKFIERGLRIVALERTAQEGEPLHVHSVGIDNVLAGRLATKHLLSRGHERIGFLSGPIQTIGRRERLAGYEAALAEVGIDVDPELIWDVGGDRNDYGDADALGLGRQGTQVLLTLSNPPTAIFAMNDMVAFGAYAGAKDLGLSVPEGLSVVGIDDLALSEVVDPGLTTIRQPIEEIANAAVAQVLNTGDETDAQHDRFRPTLVLRGSTGPPNGSTTPSTIPKESPHVI